MVAQASCRSILLFHVFPDLLCIVHLYDALLLSDHPSCEFYMFHSSLVTINYPSKQDMRTGLFPETICLFHNNFFEIAQSHAQCCT